MELSQHILEFKNISELREWLIANHLTEKHAWIKLSTKADPTGVDYAEAVKQAICFGWIDGTAKNVSGKFYRKFSPRRKNSSWTDLNLERARELIENDLMFEEGFKKLPENF